MTRSALPRSIGVWGGAAIMVGVMIGSGIFRTPSAIAQEMGSPALILLLWVAGGAVCLLGAFTFTELACLYPRSGGMYVYLHEGLGPTVAFVFGWTYMLITQPMAIAGIATVFSEHLNRLAGLHVDDRIWTCAAIVGLTYVNVTGMKRGAGIAVALTGIKAAALAAIVVLSVVLLKGDTAHFAAAPNGSKTLLAALAPVLAAILWTYDGWSDVSAVAEEVTEPQRKIPRIFLLGTVGITLLYVAVNAAYMYMIPLAEMRETETVAPLIMSRLVGPAGATVATAMVMLSVLGAAHGSIIVGSRVMFAQSRDRLLFAFPGRVHPRFQTPATALWIQGLLACAACIVLKKFETLMGGFVFSMWIFYGLAGATIYTLRRRRPNAERPYRCWGYPYVPAVFIASAAFMTALAVYDQPQIMWRWLIVVGAGVPAYHLWRRFAPVDGEAESRGQDEKRS